MKFIYVERSGSAIEVYVYTLNLSKRTLTVRNYCSHSPSVLVIYSNTFSPHVARQFLHCVDYHDSSSVHDFFAYELKHGSESYFSLACNPFFTADGKPRRKLFDYL